MLKYIRCKLVHVLSREFFESKNHNASCQVIQNIKQLI